MQNKTITIETRNIDRICKVNANEKTAMENIFRKIRRVMVKSTDREDANRNASENEKIKIGSESLVSESKWPQSHLSSSFSSALQCFQLKRDIDQLLDMQWVMEHCGEKKEKVCLSNMEVGTMSEFLERLQKDLSEGTASRI